jgi:two-component sensor histidine kinase
MIRLSDQEVIVVARDVTQRQQAEAQLHASLQEKEALLKEVHHRVKNNLQIISSLLTLQADQVNDPGALELLRESRNRVRSMAQIHETLYRSADLSRADFAAYIESLGSQLFRSYAVDPGRVRWHAEVAPVSLDLDRAIPCGLILNELISNALKHAFPEGRSGEIVVRLYVTPEGMYTLVVSDNGVGLPEGRNARPTGSLGLQLVATLARQLRGRLELERHGGTTFRLTFPA